MRNGYLGTLLGSIVFRSLGRACLLTGPLASIAACAATDSSDGGGGGGSGGGGSVGGWTAMPLLDDSSRPDRVVNHKGLDVVTGIYYESPDKGFIVSQEGGNEVRGGAVFTANRSAVTAVAFSGDGTGLRLLGSIDFTGLERTANGYIAMAYANDVISSTDGGATFKIAKNGAPDDFGIEPVMAYQVTSTGTTLVRDTGVITVSSDAPGPDATYADVWAPNATQPIPDPVPPNQCQIGPRGAGLPRTHDSVYMSADRQFIAYTANEDTQSPEICISHDGGRSFFPHVLDVPEAAEDFTPTGVLFTGPMTGIAWFAQPIAGAYIKRTTDGGNTWGNVTLPGAVASKDLELPAGFFAPDGQHGWLAGFDHDSSRALLLATTDGGASWATVAGVADAVDAFEGGKLYSGFALDATHIWIGGAGGLLMHN
jgi:hypothetical protein